MVKNYRNGYSLCYKIMRITTLITGIQACFATLLLAGNLTAQSVTLEIKQESVKQIFIRIEKQASVSFVYENETLANLPKISLKANNEPLAGVLKNIEKLLPLQFKQNGAAIGVLRIKEEVKSAPINKNNNKGGTAAPNDVSGKVTDKNGEPLAGATVRLKGTGLVTTTDKAGAFHFPALPENSVLIVSFVGFQTTELAVGNQSNLTIRIEPSFSKLDEVVVIPYGTTTQRLNTGSVGKISGIDIQKQPVSDPLATLEGRIPGLVVTQSTGVPGGAFRVEIRGRTAIARTITDDQPLFIIDGVPYAPNNSQISTLPSALGNFNTDPRYYGGISPLNSINPQDIESIEVLKDADATAIYGSRGANGVVLITTKKGKAGKTSIEANLYSGVSKSVSNVEMMDTRQYLSMRRQAFTNDNATPNLSNAYDFLAWDTTRYTNFPKFLNGETANTTDAQLSLSGGVINTQFLIGGSFHRETTITPGDLAYNRGTAHFNINHASTSQRLKVSLTGSYAADHNNLTSGDMAGYTMLPPNMQIYDNQGALAWNEGGVVTVYNNPLAYLYQTFEGKTQNLLANLQVSYLVIPNLTVKLSTGYNTIGSSNNSLYPATAQNPDNIINRTHSYSVNNFNSWIIEPQAEFAKQLNKGKLNILMGATNQAINNEGNYFDASGYTSDNLINSAAGATSIRAGNSLSQYRYAAVFSRFNFNWDEKYLINLSGRRDGSSRFGPGKQFATFGSAGAAWIFSNESLFRKHLGFLSFGKLRGSHGVTGNDKITDYNYLDTWATTPQAYNGTVGLYPNKLYNPDYHWEKTIKTEVALELGALKDRILFTGTYYNNHSSNQLVSVAKPSTSGGSVIENFPAKVENTGWEFSVNTVNLKSKTFSWSSSANISFPRNRLVSFPGLANSSYYSSLVEGQSLNLIYKYKYTGIDTQTGLYTFEDVDGNGTFDQKDYQPLGDTDPKFYGGFQNSFSFKGFQVDIFLTFKKQKGYNYLATVGYAPGTINNMPAIMYGKFWAKPGDQTELAKLTQEPFGIVANNGTDFTQLSDGGYSDASYVRLKNLSVSYSVPGNWLNRYHISRLRFYLQGQNLLTFTGYELGDPETQNILRTPPLQTITAGIQLTL